MHQLVQRMGGNIQLESEKDRGSTFTVNLPLAIDRVERKEELEGIETTDVSGMHILLVEDNAFNLEIAEAPYTFDLVLMDLMMPEMDVRQQR